MLRHRRPERRLQLGTVGIEYAVGGGAAIIKGDLQLSASDEALVVVEIIGVLVLVQGRSTTGKRRRLRSGCPFQLKRSRKHRIQHLRCRTRAVGRDVDTSRPGRSTTGRSRCAAWTTAGSE